MFHYLYRNQDALILIPIQVQTKINIELRKYRPQVELVAQPFDGKRHPTRHQCCGSQRSNYRWSAIAQITASRRECCQQITWHFVVHIFLWWFCVFHAQYSYCHVLHGIRIGHDNRFCRCVLLFSFVICNCLSPHRWCGEKRNENGNNNTTDGGVVGDGDESKKRFFQEMFVFRTVSSVVARLHQMFCIRYREMLRCQYLTVLRNCRCCPAACVPSFRRTKTRPWPWHRTMRNRWERSRAFLSVARQSFPCGRSWLFEPAS